jgi:phosphatidylglycerophosphate synthase
MLDRFASFLIRPAIALGAQASLRAGLTANAITVAGFGLGVLSAILIALHHPSAGLTVIALSRLCDALDGAVARLTECTDAGGFLDLALDFVFYASIPLAFAIADPLANALAAAVLLATFVGTGTSFLAFAAIAAKRGMRNLDYPDKSVYFLGGLTEATETLACFAAMCLWPQYFSILAYGFAFLCAVTAATRIGWGWRSFR